MEQRPHSVYRLIHQQYGISGAILGGGISAPPRGSRSKRIAPDLGNIMNWWLAITIFIAAALAYSYRVHTRERRHLARLFSLLAPDCQGEVKPGNWLVFPQLHFKIENRHYLVTAMATAGTDTAESGPFTLVDLQLPVDTHRKIRVRRGAKDIKRLMDGIVPDRHPRTTHKEFDDAFQIEGSDQAFAFSLLEASVRQQLLASRIPHLDMRVDGNKISVHMDGIAQSKADIAELVDIASLLADQCSAK